MWSVIGKIKNAFRIISLLKILPNVPFSILIISNLKSHVVILLTQKFDHTVCKRITQSFKTRPQEQAIKFFSLHCLPQNQTF